MGVRFSMAVNDDNGYGQHTGKLRAAQFDGADGSDLYLECTGKEIMCRKLAGKAIQIGRQKFHILGYHCYVGNMMWDAATVTPDTANAIADLLRAGGNYQPSSGTDVMWERWENDDPLFPDDVSEAQS